MASNALERTSLVGGGSFGLRPTSLDSGDVIPSAPQIAPTATPGVITNAGVPGLNSGGAFGGAGGGGGGGILDTISDLADFANDASDGIDAFRKLSNLFDAFEGGHMDGFVDQILNGDLSAASRTFDLATTFGTPGNVPGAIDFGELGMSAPDFTSGALSDSAYAAIGANSQLASLAGAGFAPGGAATSGSVFGTGTGFGATGGFGGTGTAAGTTSGAAGGGAVAGGAVAAAGFAVFMAAFAMWAAGTMDSVGGSANRALDLGPDGLLHLGAAAADNNGSQIRPDFEANLAMEALNPLISSGAITLTPWESNAQSQFTIFPNQGIAETAEHYINGLVQSGNLIVNDAAAFQDAFSNFGEDRTAFMREQHEVALGIHGEKIERYNQLLSSGNPGGMDTMAELSGINPYEQMTAYGGAIGFRHEFDKMTQTGDPESVTASTMLTPTQTDIADMIIGLSSLNGPPTDNDFNQAGNALGIGQSRVKDLFNIYNQLSSDQPQAHLI